MIELCLELDKDSLEKQLLSIFPGALIATEKAFDLINEFKSNNFACSQVGMMLYGNGYNLRGQSKNFPNGLVYIDQGNLFGVGLFRKEQGQKIHLMIIAPQGPNCFQSVIQFINKVRKNNLFHNEIYIRHISEQQKEVFIAEGMKDITASPWHDSAPEEDEHFPNRVFYLNDFLLQNTCDEIVIENLPYPDASNFKRKPRLLHNRFQNYLERNSLDFILEPYDYSVRHCDIAKLIVTRYFASRSERGGVVGSSPEDYFPIIFQKPKGINGQDYFAYIGRLRAMHGTGKTDVPVAFFVGERLGPKDRAGLYATITSRFEEDATRAGLPADGYTALPQFCTLEVLKQMFLAGIKVVDIGGSETEGLDTQKRQLGGRPEKTYWVLAS